MTTRLCCHCWWLFFHFLNPTIDGLTEATPVDDDSIFGAMISNVTTLHML
jgi:hypothetical protein